MALTDFIQSFRRYGVTRWRLGWWQGGGALTIGGQHYARAVYSAIIDKITIPLKGTTWQLQQGSTADFAAFEYFFNHDSAELVARLIHDGVVRLHQEKGVITFANGGELVLHSADWAAYGQSTYDIIKSTLDYLDNILNASETSVRRLGRVILMSPESDIYGSKMTPEELKSEEDKFQNDYGFLQDQHVIKILNYPYRIQEIDISGDKLNLDTRLQSAVKIICDKLGVPYELVAAAIVGNPNQTGVYQSEAQKRLYQTVHYYDDLFRDLARQMGLAVEWDTPDAPQDYSLDAEQLTKSIIENITAAEAAGYISHEEAVAAYRAKVSRYDEDLKN